MNFGQYIDREKENSRPVCFFTVNDFIDENVLEKELKSLSDCGYGGIYFHARSGFIGSYLSEEWFSLAEKAVGLCEKYKLEFWVYDEFGWPSGIAGGEVLKKLPGSKQKRLVKNVEPLKKIGRAVAYYDEKGDITLSKERAKYSLEEVTVDGYTDVLDRVATEEFIRVTHREYARRFGGRIKGFFTDEPQFGLTAPAWNDEIERALFARYEKDALALLPALFSERLGGSKEKEFRAFYFELCSSLFIENYIRPLSEWCDENGYMLTGHILEEKKLSYEVRSCADVFDVYKEMQCPGMDWLGSKTGNAVAPKQVSSVFQRYGKYRCVSETGATMGYGISVSEIRNLYEWEIALGVTNICGIIPYSVRGRRKRDYPSGIITMQPYFEKFRGFNDRLARLCAVSSLEETVDVLIVQPLQSAREEYVYGSEARATAALDELYENAVETLTKRACFYHIASLKEVENGVFTSEGLRIGRCTYKSALVLDEYSSAVFNEKENKPAAFSVYTEASVVPSRVKADETLFVTARKYGELTVLMAKNTGETSVSNAITLDGKLPVNEYDLDGGRVLRYEKGVIGAKQTVVFICGKEQESDIKEVYNVEKIDENDFSFNPLEKNRLVLDFADYLLENGENGRLPVIKLFEKLIDEEYAGRLKMTFSFENRGYDGAISLAVEDSHKFEVYLNGEKLSFKNDVSEQKKPIEGLNVVILTVDYRQKENVCKIWKGETGVESDFNMIGDMLELENVCVSGDFGVYFDKSNKKGNVSVCSGAYIAPQKKRGRSDDLTADGFPFYAGAFALEKEIELHSGKNAVLPMIENGCAEACGQVVFGDKPIKISACGEGKTKFKIVLYNTLRNYFGPDHNIYGEGMNVGFTTFSSAPGWCDPQGKDMWTDDYMLVPFGVKFGE